MKTHARVVVIGGGMMGASLLYHLALEGCTDTVLIEKDELTSGSTWHAAGQCPSITGSYNLAKIHAYSNALYPRLEALTGQYVSWHPSGGLRFANNPQELAWLKYVLGYSKSIGFRMEIVGIDEIRRLNPFLTTEGVLAAAWTLDDGHGDPSGLCNALAKAARDLGATVIRRNRVTDMRQRSSGEWEVITEQGVIVAEMVVNAAGCYAREVAAMVGADAPITNMQHHYVITHPIPEFMQRNEEIPVIRDSYTSGYLRQEQKSGLMGIYESTGLTEAWAPQGLPGVGLGQRALPGRSRSHRPLARACHRAHADLRRSGYPARDQRRDSAHARRRAAARAGAGPRELLDVLRNLLRHRAGRRLRQVSRPVDGARRCRNQHDGIRSAPFRPVRDQSLRARQGVSGLPLDLHTRLPGEEEPAGRPSKVSPLYERLKTQGCVYTETFGWERPKWFSLDGRSEESGYGRTNVFEVVREEVAAVRASASAFWISRDSPSST